MATAAGAYPWPASPPLRPSPTPDTTSPVYPGRPIRPMPKRRLRDRLSAEHAASIDFPPEPQSSSPIFQYPYVQEGSDATQVQVQRRGLRAGSQEQVHCVDCGHEHSEVDSDADEDDEERLPTMQFSPDSLQITRRDGDYYGSPTSADGYDSIENMSNKKKRKIPQSGMGGGGHGPSNSLSTDLAKISLSSRDGSNDDQDEATGTSGGHAGTSYAYAHNSPGGITAVPSTLSGPGRGRFSRSGRGSLDRRPLGASTNGLNAPASHKVPNSYQQYGKTAPVSSEPGIISAAIANAAQNMPSTPGAKGQENVSMLQQHASKSPPQKTDFTFTPEGGENRPVWPGGQAPSGPSSCPPPSAKVTSRPRGSQTSPNGVPTPPSIPGSYPLQTAQQPISQSATTAGAAAPPPPPQSTSQNAGQQQHPPPPSKPRKPRSRARTFDIAARQRRLQKEYQNYQNPPKREDIWICEFCEYEAIFGKQPFALIWDYEKKDQAERKRLAERRRLLEKAKMKGRKGKKGSKKNNGSAGHNKDAGHVAGGNHQVSNHGGGGQHYDDTVEDDEYYDGEYHYDDVHDDDLPPMPHNTPGSYPPEPPLNQHQHHHHGHSHHSQHLHNGHDHASAKAGYAESQYSTPELPDAKFETKSSK
ncbi:uncharacterized protein PV09_04357 [Verruconis gallopava]|uniref:Uncharacterized protein n=1 Tax=Verruconis gallopava TaxID=253628 RepID=A0A0D2AZT5_9PEZI|nr:uncharacterized protein PV09_04357 [Verruconis gallopava]KIW04609.1 hypothetical protein PV09_04357 [Verruconis gallopava]